LKATLVGIYRRRNAGHVRALLAPALERGWSCAWWALDETAPQLSSVTVGEGAGLKLPLLNETLRRAGSTPGWTVCSDDDLRFRRGNVVSFVQRAVRSSFDLAQPARARGTQLSHGITIAPRLSRARLTTFVESGPLFAIAPTFRNRILPFPEERGMGWGIEIDWHDLVREGCRLGIIDSTPIEHLGTLGGDYNASEVKSRLFGELASRGHPEWVGMRETLRTWHVWQPRPPWERQQRGTSDRPG
jgi:hypothetical protein